MLQTYKQLLFILLPLILISFVETSNAQIKNESDYTCASQRNKVNVQDIFNINKNLNTHIVNSQDQFYDYLPYEDKTCDNSNSYLNASLEKSNHAQWPMNTTQLSPVCTFASLNQTIKGAFETSCNDKPKFSDSKPCLTKKYHKLIHNQITLAAECFQQDPKTLFSLYTTESYLNVNVRPGENKSAEGIAQLMPETAVADINNEIPSHYFEDDNRYKRYLRHFKIKAIELNTIDPNKNRCLEHIENLEKLPTKPQEKGQCSNLNLDDKVSQDIYYSIAYLLSSAQTSINELIDSNFLFNADYSEFLDSLPMVDKNNIKSCNGLKSEQLQKCEVASKNLVKKIFNDSKDKINNVLIYFGARNKNSDSQPTSDINPIGPNNLKAKIINNFPQYSDANSNEYKKSPLYNLLNDPFVQRYCNIESVPQLEQFNFKNFKDREKGVVKFNKYIKKLLFEISECQKQKSFAFIDVYNLMKSDNKKIINEVGFYHHNKGPSINSIFKDYINDYKSNNNGKNMDYISFTGRDKNSFVQYLIKTEKNESQGSNFIYNNPASEDAYGSPVPGRDSSTSANMNKIRAEINRFKSSLNPQQQKHDDLNYLSSKEGFEQLCSHY